MFQEKVDNKQLNDNCFVIYACLIACLIILLFFHGCIPYETGNMEPGKTASTEKAKNNATYIQKTVSGQCKSETDRKICDDLTRALNLYYQIANHEPPASYERDSSMRILANSAVITRQRTLDESGKSDSLYLYDAFIRFVDLREKAAELSIRMDFDSAGPYRVEADRYQDEILKFCDVCDDELK